MMIQKLSVTESYRFKKNRITIFCNYYSDTKVVFKERYNTYAKSCNSNCYTKYPVPPIRVAFRNYVLIIM